MSSYRICLVLFILLLIALNRIDFRFFEYFGRRSHWRLFTRGRVKEEKMRFVFGLLRPKDLARIALSDVEMECDGRGPWVPALPVQLRAVASVTQRTLPGYVLMSPASPEYLIAPAQRDIQAFPLDKNAPPLGDNIFVVVVRRQSGFEHILSLTEDTSCA